MKYIIPKNMTKEQEDFDNDLQLTTWENPLEKFHSSFGFILYKDWVKKIQEENSLYGKGTEVLEENGKIALFYTSKLSLKKLKEASQ